MGMKPFTASTIAAPIKTTSACTGYPAYFPLLLGIHAPAGALQLGNPWPLKARAVARPRALALATALTKALALAMAARDGLNDCVPETALQRRWSARPCSLEGRRKDMVVETICFHTLDSKTIFSSLFHHFQNHSYLRYSGHVGEDHFYTI